jgi:hypothetical protein
MVRVADIYYPLKLRVGAGQVSCWYPVMVFVIE